MDEKGRGMLPARARKVVDLMDIAIEVKSQPNFDKFYKQLVDLVAD